MRGRGFSPLVPFPPPMNLAKRTNLAVLISEYNADIIICCESHLDHSILSSQILPSIWLQYSYLERIEVMEDRR